MTARPGSSGARRCVGRPSRRADTAAGGTGEDPGAQSPGAYAKPEAILTLASEPRPIAADHRLIPAIRRSHRFSRPKSLYYRPCRLPSWVTSLVSSHLYAITSRNGAIRQAGPPFQWKQRRNRYADIFQKKDPRRGRRGRCANGDGGGACRGRIRQSGSAAGRPDQCHQPAKRSPIPARRTRQWPTTCPPS